MSPVIIIYGEQYYAIVTMDYTVDLAAIVAMDVMNLPFGPTLVDASLYSAILVFPLRFMLVIVLWMYMAKWLVSLLFNAACVPLM